MKSFDEETGRYLTKKESHARKEIKKRQRLNKVKNYLKEMRELSIEIGNCTCCFKVKEESKFKICKKCRLKRRKNNNNNFTIKDRIKLLKKQREYYKRKNGR